MNQPSSQGDPASLARFRRLILWACLVAGIAFGWQARSQPDHWKGADPFPKVDAASFHAAGRLTLAGHPAAAYGHRVEELRIEMETAAGLPRFAPRDLTLVWVHPGEELSNAALRSGYPDANVPVFVYPPGALGLAAIWSLLPWRLATVVLDMASLGLLALMLAWMLGLVGVGSDDVPESRQRRALGVWMVAVMLMVHWWPVRFGLFTGQVSVLTVVAGMALCVGRCRSRVGEFALGAIAALFLSLKLFPLLLLLVPLMRGDRARLSGAVSALGLVVVVGFVLGGIDIHRDFLAILGEMGRGARPWAANQSADAAFHRFLYSVNFTRDWLAIEPAPLRGILQAVTLAMAGFIALFVFRRQRVADPRMDGALLLGAAALVPPVAWSHYGVFFLPAVVCLGLRVLHRERGHGVDVLVGAMFLGAWAINPELYAEVMPLTEGRIGSDLASVLARAACGLPWFSAVLVLARLAWHHGRMLAIQMDR